MINALDDKKYVVVCSDNLELLRSLPDNSIDSMVTDPPSGIAFMGHEWDKDKGDRDAWIEWLCVIMKEALRVLKPGAHGLVWSLPRTSHWTATALENAGFEIRDRIDHIFGSGFPKSHDISKACDRMAGAEREVVGRDPYYSAGSTKNFGDGNKYGTAKGGDEETAFVTAPATDEARQWQGWGTALKPAHEDWILVRKPFPGTVAANVKEWGTGGINIDGCRVGLSGARNNGNSKGTIGSNSIGVYGKAIKQDYNKGRFPANIIHDGSDEVLAIFPQSKRQQGDVAGTEQSHTGQGNCYGDYDRIPSAKRNDNGSAARFFYCAKPSKSEKNAGLDMLEELHKSDSYREPTGNVLVDRLPGCGNKTQNHHPTVKAMALCQYLCRLITPPGGVVLDMFMGSGSIGCGAVTEGFRYIGCDNVPEYVQISDLRIRYWLEQPRQENLL